MPMNVGERGWMRPKMRPPACSRLGRRAGCGDLQIKLSCLPLMACGLLVCRRTGGERVYRRVGELVSEQVWGGGPAGAPNVLNELDHHPRPATPPAPTRRNTAPFSVRSFPTFSAGAYHFPAHRQLRRRPERRSWFLVRRTARLSV